MNKEKIFDYLNVVATTTLGVVGSLTEIPALQALAFMPAVGHRIYTELSEDCHFADGNIGRDLEALLKDACLSTQEILSQGSKDKAEFFRYANARIEINKNITHLAAVTNAIRDDLEIEKRAQAVDLTTTDIREMAQLFAKNFTAILYKYPALESYLFTASLFDHEKRISYLEEAKTSTKYDVLPITELIQDDKKFYYEKFDETLFLHRGLPEEKVISLKELYTSPGAETKGHWRKTIKKASYDLIEDAIKQFISYSSNEPGAAPIDILFIEGQAAVGKSSLTAWLCWHYNNGDKISNEILGNRQLIVIKLRDISRSYATHGVLNFQLPFLQFYSYLLKKDESLLAQEPQWEENCKEIFKNSVLVLEGFDELCMVESLFEGGKSTYFQNLSNELSRMDCGCKVIVTTRPSYLKVEGLDFPKAHLSIRPFSVNKRESWLKKYETKCTVDDDIKRILLCDDIQVLDGIIDSPLTLYMIVAKNVHISETSSLWDIYNQIFSEEVYKRHYERGNPHDINQYRDLLYRLTSEIANAVSREEHLFATVDKLLEIKNVRTLLDHLHVLDKEKNPNYQSMKDILEDCFGLASYFKISEKADVDGQSKCAVEFYHNNIKDYFCCEYIWMNLERIYSKIPNDPFAMEKWFISNFQEMFQYSVFLKDSSEGARSMAIRFLESKIGYLKEHDIRTDFICQEMKNHYLQHFFGKMLQTGMLYHYEYTGKDNILDMIACIYSAVFSIYHTIYQPYLTKNEKIPIAKREFTIDIGTSFIYRLLFPVANIKNQSYVRFDGIMFSGIDFGQHDFSYSSFQNCLMIGCNFEDCDLRGTDFSFASLQHADLSKAIIDETTRFEGAEFEFTKITKEQSLYLSKWSKKGLLIIDS